MTEYSADSIQILDGVEAVRTRPGMYVGNTEHGGLLELLWGVVGNAIDQHLIGRASTVRVSIEDSVVTVDDDGVGIAVELVRGVPAIQTVFSTLRCGGRHDRGVVGVGASIGGAGLAVVSALSDRLEVQTTRAGRRHRQAYTRGRPTTAVEDLGPAERVGTRVRFTPDPVIFAWTQWDLTSVRRRLWELACLTPGLALVFNGETLRAPDGLAAWVRARAGRPWLQTSLIALDAKRDGVRTELALTWTGGAGVVSGWANRRCTEAGSHIDGFWSGLAWALAPGVSAEAAREVLAPGLVAAVQVELPEPTFRGATRGRLEAAEAAADVARLLVNELPVKLKSEPGLASLLRERLHMAPRAS